MVLGSSWLDSLLKMAAEEEIKEWGLVTSAAIGLDLLSNLFVVKQRNESVILKMALFHFWQKWFKNTFVFYAHSYIFLQRKCMIPRIEAGLLNAYHLTSWNKDVHKVNWRSWHLADVRAKLHSSHVLKCILNAVCYISIHWRTTEANFWPSRANNTCRSQLWVGLCRTSAY
jgi:hypothetical protein